MLRPSDIKKLSHISFQMLVFVRQNYFLCSVTGGLRYVLVLDLLRPHPRFIRRNKSTVKLPPTIIVITLLLKKDLHSLYCINIVMLELSLLAPILISSLIVSASSGVTSYQKTFLFLSELRSGMGLPSHSQDFRSGNWPKPSIQRNGFSTYLHSSQ